MDHIPSIDEQIAYLRDLPDDQIDTDDNPEVTYFLNAKRVRFYRPIKKTVTLRLDTDVLDWFRKNNPKYQTAINQVLRCHVMSELSCFFGGIACVF